MWVTCYTDASFGQGKNRDGGWAVWLRSSEGRVVRSGSCPEYVLNSNQAELSAIYAGIYLAATTWPSTSAVLVCSDCQGALALAEPSAKPAKHEPSRRLQGLIRGVLDEYGLRLKLRWVKGHQNRSGSVRAYLNSRCDRLANEARSAAGPKTQSKSDSEPKAKLNATQKRRRRRKRARARARKSTSMSTTRAKQAPE